jgi:hypothetical protein
MADDFRELFGETVTTTRAIEDLDRDTRNAVETIWQEVNQKAEAAPTELLMHREVAVRETLHVTRIVGQWPTPPGPTELAWRRERLTPEPARELRSPEGVVTIESLTPTARRAIEVITETATADATRAILGRAEQPVGAALTYAPRRRWPTFISYRFDSLDLAKRLHACLARLRRRRVLRPISRCPRLGGW